MRGLLFGMLMASCGALALAACAGDSGAAGETGERGLPGPRGPAGADGADGTGTQGPQGPEGPAGEQGPGSTTGPAGGSVDYAFWIGDLGPTGPLFTGAQQFPFACETVESNLGNPVPDNWDQIGDPVRAVPSDPGSPLLGYSKSCSIPTRVDYFYFKPDRSIARFDRASPPAEVMTVQVNGAAVPVIVRVETGTMNRFLYTVAMLAPASESLVSPFSLDNSKWNGKLVYWFRGGVGIGHRQGTAAWHGGLWREERNLFPEVLAHGYALATSSGNTADVQYNLKLHEENAVMVKRHFVATYGDPDYTVGLGASGGAVQQYMIGQNRPGLLDAGIPINAYPDMVTQTIHVGDCNLLEQYMIEEATINPSSQWASWGNHAILEGMSASDTVGNPFTGQAGSTTCINGWAGAEQVALNPHIFNPDPNPNALQLEKVLLARGYPASVVEAVHWTHWDDLRNIYGVRPDGFAPIPADNVGVQYGLKALVDGRIDKAEFLKLNSCAGSWREQKDYAPTSLLEDPFDSTNMNRDRMACRGGVPAPRRTGDLWAMQAAYLGGQVFVGKIDMPVIDLRPYLDDQLDMHDARQSFSVRERIRRAKGNHDNQVIWFTGSADHVTAKVLLALEVLGQYLSAGNRPSGFVDRCFDASGAEIASGAGAWAGILDSSAPGACTTAFPLHSSSRMVAGDSIAGDLFKCQLKSMDTALTDGTYGTVSFTAEEVAKLKAIFPTGVCDYSKPDAGKPAGF